MTQTYNNIFTSPCIHVKDPTRSVIVHTGMAGAKMFHLAIKREAVCYRVVDLETKKIITEAETVRLYEMIHSPDLENLELAIMIIDEKEKLIKKKRKWRLRLK